MSTDSDAAAAESGPISGDQFSQLMAAIQATQHRMDGKLMEFHEELCQGQEDAATTALKRVRHEKRYSFKRKGNEEQAGFNSRLEETLSEAQATLAVPESSQAIARAQEALKKGAQVQSALPLPATVAYSARRPATAPALPRAVGSCFASGDISGAIAPRRPRPKHRSGILCAVMH